jgi:hypothetical protein
MADITDMADSGQRFTSDSTIVDWFGFHPADTARKRAGHEIVRTQFWLLALQMNDLLPEGPDKTVALRSLREAAMQCNATLACNGGPRPEILPGGEASDELTWQTWVKVWSHYAADISPEENLVV